MDTRHRTSSGVWVARCVEEDRCTFSSCDICLEEIPADAIRITDAQDYVHHFCGLDCLDAWQKQGEQSNQ